MKFNHPSSHKETEDDYFSGSEAIESGAEEDNGGEEKQEGNYFKNFTVLILI